MCYYWGISTKSYDYKINPLWYTEKNEVTDLKRKVERLEKDVEKWKQRLIGSLWGSTATASSTVEDADVEQLLNDIERSISNRV